MELYKVQALLESKGFIIDSTDRLPNDTGEQLRLTNGAIVNVFDNGTVTVQGKNSDPVERALGLALAGIPKRGKRHGVNKTVFVVYYHDTKGRALVERTIRRRGWNPVIVDGSTDVGNTGPQGLELLFSDAH